MMEVMHMSAIREFKQDVRCDDTVEELRMGWE
jgi:hypothetical protein